MNRMWIRLAPACRIGLLVLLWAGLPGSSLAETSYQYTGEPFNNVTGAYSTADRVTGQFTTAAPLPANLALQDVSGLVTSFSFSDGHQTITELDLGSFWLFDFMVSTDSAGEIADWRIRLFVDGSDRLIQTVSDSFGDSDNGEIDLSNYGAIANTPGTWIIPSPTLYQYTGEPFNNVTGAYSTADRVTGQFTAVTPLPANLAFQDISGLVTSFSFSDGHQTITELDLGSFWVFDFMVSTDSAGEIADWRIRLFVDGSDRLIQTVSDSFGDSDNGEIDLSNYGAIANTPGTWVIQSTPVVPAASRAELAVLAACLLALAAPALRRVRWRGQTGSMQDEHGEWV